MDPLVHLLENLNIKRIVTSSNLCKPEIIAMNNLLSIPLSKGWQDFCNSIFFLQRRQQIINYLNFILWKNASKKLVGSFFLGKGLFLVEDCWIKVPLTLLVDNGSLLYALVIVFHPDRLLTSKFRLSRCDNLHKD